MKKRIFAFIGAVTILLAVLAVPVFASKDPEENFVTYQGPTPNTIYTSWDTSPQVVHNFGGITKQQVLDYMYYSAFSININMNENLYHYMKKYSVSGGTGVVFWRAMVVFEVVDAYGQNSAYNLVKDGYVYVRCTGLTNVQESDAQSFVWGINTTSNYNEATSVFRMEWDPNTYHVHVTKNTLFDVGDRTLTNAYIIPMNGLLTGNVNNDFSVFAKNTWMKYCNGYLMERGYGDGYWDAADVYYDSGYADGEEAGFDTGFDAGWEGGVGFGYDEGYEQGYYEGNDVGYESGTNDGYMQGLQSKESTWKMVWKILEAPTVFFDSMLNFEILGINFASAIKAVLTLVVVAGVVFIIWRAVK